MLYNTKRENKQFYVGLTNNIVSRIKQHKNGKVYFTQKDHHDWELVYFETYASRHDAALREQGLKHNGRAFRQVKERIKDSLSSAIALE